MMRDSLGRIDLFIQKIDQAENLDAILDIIRVQIARLGFQRFTYWLMWHPDGRRASVWLTSYPREWIDYYVDKNMAGDDLVVRYGAAQKSPYIWSEVKKIYRPTDAQKIVFGESAAAGLRAGGSVPIYGPGSAKALFSVANDESEEQFQKLFFDSRHELHLIATYAHEKIIGLGLQKNDRRSVRLTAREIEILTWTARGKTRWEISQILSLSEETVKRHLDHVCRKLETNNKTHATTIAILNGLIFP